jgi:hypothetical protein
VRSSSFTEDKLPTPKGKQMDKVRIPEILEAFPQWLHGLKVAAMKDSNTLFPLKDCLSQILVLSTIQSFKHSMIKRRKCLSLSMCN